MPIYSKDFGEVTGGGTFLEPSVVLDVYYITTSSTYTIDPNKNYILYVRDWSSNATDDRVYTILYNDLQLINNYPAQSGWMSVTLQDCILTITITHANIKFSAKLVQLD